MKLPSLSQIGDGAKECVLVAFRIVKSPLIGAIFILGIMWARAPYPVSISVTFVSLVILTNYSNLLPRELLYEVSLTDQIVREKASHVLPNQINQPWWHEIDHGITLGGLPLKSKGHLDALHQAGINVVLSVVEDFELETKTFFSEAVSPKEWAEKGILHHQIASPDMEPISIAKINEAVNFLHSHQGQKIYLHCKAGRGRSASILVCYLMRYHNMSLKDAIDKVKAIRGVVRFRSEQMDNLRAYELSLFQTS